MMHDADLVALPALTTPSWPFIALVTLWIVFFVLAAAVALWPRRDQEPAE